jgi:hypothetical protein
MLVSKESATIVIPRPVYSDKVNSGPKLALYFHVIASSSTTSQALFMGMKLYTM